MKKPINYARTLPIVLAALAAAQTGNALAAGNKSAAARKSVSHVISGPEESTRYGPIQVTISVKNKRIYAVKATNSPQDARSVFIQGQAIPILKQETLSAQSANINEVSGATDISGAYIQSLQAAVKKARKTKEL
jgi:uncharacterized protein with FMN-binding domain